MGEDDFERARHLARMSAEDLGRSEEEVKINFVVPLLELLGHSRLRFEYRHKDILLRDGLPAGATVVVETKRAGERLDRHVEQIARYSAQERSFLSVLTNGKELRIYAPLWAAAPSFAHTLIWTLGRADLARAEIIFELFAILGADALASGQAARRVAGRQAKLQRLWRQAEAVRFAARQQREGLEPKLRAVEKSIAALKEEKRQVLAELSRIETEETETLRGLYGCFGERPVEPPAPEPEPAAAAQARPAAPLPPVAVPLGAAEWDDDALCHGATDMRRRLFGAFVEAGQRSMHLRDLEDATGISKYALLGAAGGLLKASKDGGKDTLLSVAHPPQSERERRGVVLTVAEKYWPSLQRLYGDRDT